MALAILHTGQTGVERGACRSARATQCAVSGFCNYEGRDEIGTLSPEIAWGLTRCTRRGVRSALRATLETAHAIVIGVADVEHATEVTGVPALRRSARALGIPCWVVDPSSDLTAVGARLRELERTLPSDTRVLVTGPRLTRWRDGESLGFRIVSELALALRYSAVRRPHRILVVDDHTDTALATCTLIRALGHEGRAATTGLQGLELATRLGPDIGLFDIGLPDISGYELAERMRTRGDAMFLAAITGWDQAMDASRAFAAGFDRHVIKPANAEIIRSLIEQADRQLAVVG